MKKFSTGSNSEDKDSENVDGSSLENQEQPAATFKVYFFPRYSEADTLEAVNRFCEFFDANGKKSIVAQSR